MKRIAILGSTGSIGRSAVEIIERAPEDFEVVGLAAGRNAAELSRQLGLFPKSLFSMKDPSAISALLDGNPSLGRRNAGSGEEGLEHLIDETSPDLVINALVGKVGLAPTIKALELGCTVAIANKEALVAGGELIADMVRGNRDLIIPIDSEHFSISRCLRGYGDEAEEIVLTASGGPFYGREFSDLEVVALGDVLNHPTWKMGKKVTVDCAHLLNKGLEVIEAHWLFGFPYDRISVLIHPQSVVHSIVKLRDGSLLAHLGPADMRLPIMNALYHPRMREFPWESLDLEVIGSLDFFPMKEERFPAFGLSMQAARAGGTAPAVLSASDEVAVEAFLSGRIGFLAILDWIEEALSAHRVRPVKSLDDVLDADMWARDFLAGKHREATDT